MLDDSASSPNSPRHESVLLRLAWMVAVPAILLCPVFLAGKAPWTLGAYDVVLLLLVVIAIAARAADALLFEGTTARGEPATRVAIEPFVVHAVTPKAHRVGLGKNALSPRRRHDGQRVSFYHFDEALHARLGQRWIARVI